MKNKTFKRVSIVALLTLLTISSCQKLIDIPGPQSQIDSESAFADNKTAIATLNGIYAKMMASSSSFMSSSLSLYPAMSADELTYFTASSRDGFIQNVITQSNDTELNSYLWSPAYNFIYMANSCIEGARASTTLSDNVRNMVMGEALFVRSFCYFHLVNLFGDVPLQLTTNYDENKSAGRTLASIVNQQVLADLLRAESLLAADYPSTGRARPNKAAVRTLLAKYYLYQKDWQNAIKYGDLVIADSRYSVPIDLSTVFLSTSTEAIWQLAPLTPGYNTYVGYQVVPASTTSAPTFVLSDNLLAAFESGDKRKTSWVQARTYQTKSVSSPYKYKIRTGTTVTEYNMVFRLAEVYLIRAEAKAQLNDLAGALDDLNKIRNRAGLSNYSSSNQTDILAAIQKERRIELFSEWGNRWFDLKRTNQATAILSVLKPQWKSTAVLYPIPYSQIIINSNLTQNDGY